MVIRRMPRTQPSAARVEEAQPETPAPAAVRPGSRAIRRFIGGVSTKPDSKSAAKQLIAENLKLIATNNDEIDRLTVDTDIAFAAIEGLMKSNGLTHEEAMRDSIVRVLMSPKFSYRMDLVDATKAAPGIVPWAAR